MSRARISEKNDHLQKLSNFFGGVSTSVHGGRCLLWSSIKYSLPAGMIGTVTPCWSGDYTKAGPAIDSFTYVSSAKDKYAFMRDRTNSFVPCATHQKEILLADPHIVRIEPGEDMELPEIDYSIFHEGDRLKAEARLKTIMWALSCPYIIDNFEDHYDRTIWKTNLSIISRELDEYLNANSLRRNSLGSGIIASMSKLAELYKAKNPDDAAAIFGDFFAIRDKIKAADYDHLSTDKKLPLVKELKQVVFATLKLLAAKSHNQN